ncbi:hypothetical protein Trydic_g15990, partial [Trypoxylus dichotomus]
MMPSRRGAFRGPGIIILRHRQEGVPIVHCSVEELGGYSSDQVHEGYTPVFSCRVIFLTNQRALRAIRSIRLWRHRDTFKDGFVFHAESKVTARDDVEVVCFLLKLSAYDSFDDLTHDREETDGPVVLRLVGGLPGLRDHGYVSLFSQVWEVLQPKHGVAYVYRMHDEFTESMLVGTIGDAIWSWSFVGSESLRVSLPPA